MWLSQRMVLLRFERLPVEKTVVYCYNSSLSTEIINISEENYLPLAQNNHLVRQPFDVGRFVGTEQNQASW